MFIGGLPQGTTKELLNDFFVRYGPIEYTVIITEKANLDANYKDLIENEHPYYGPRINKIIKNNFGFSPY